MSKIEAQNRRHENEISLLKTGKVEDRKEIHQLRERVALLEDSTFFNAPSDDKLLLCAFSPRTFSDRKIEYIKMKLFIFLRIFFN